MPPANSPVQSTTPVEPTRSSTPAFFHSALQDLTSPVPDYASTLSLQAEHELDTDNLSFLRTQISAQSERTADLSGQQAIEDRRRRQQRYFESRQRERDRNQADTSNLDRQVQAHRAELLRQRQRSQEAWAEAMTTRANATYSSRVPDSQSLYDWAPNNQDSEDEDLRRMRAEMREAQPGTHPEVIRALATARVEERRQRSASETLLRASSTAQATTSGPQQEPSLRSAAILQSMGRNRRVSTRNRTLMSRYMMERDQRTAEASPSDGGVGLHYPDDRGTTGHASHTSVPLPQAPQYSSGHDAPWLATSSPHLLALLPPPPPPPPFTSGQIPDSLRRAQNHSPWPSVLPPQVNLPSFNGFDRPSHSSHTSLAPHPPNLPSFNGLDRASLSEMPDILRRRYLEDPKLKKPEVPEFERIIKYLHTIRSCDQEAPTASRSRPSRGSRTSLLGGLQMDIDVMNRVHNAKPHRSSWLIPGMTFAGRQQAAVDAEDPRRSSGLRLGNSDHVSTNFELNSPRPSNLAPSEPWLGRSLTSTPQQLSASPSPSLSTDSWTVKVALHDVDYEKMTLQGTMEAFNVPSCNPTASNTSKTTFSTYVEGELIDFTNHTLLTEPDRAFAMETSPVKDAEHWRKLEPFARLTDEEIARALLDRQWIEEQLMGKYILMRWKERCFVKPTFTSFSNMMHPAPRSSTSPSASENAPPHQMHPSATTSFMPGNDGNGYGLSISGFYYVSLRRSDGHCEGLYFDPKSTPYQRLELKPVLEGSWGCGAWELR